MEVDVRYCRRIYRGSPCGFAVDIAIGRFSLTLGVDIAVGLDEGITLRLAVSFVGDMVV